MPRLALALTLALAAAPGLARDHPVPPAIAVGKPVSCIPTVGLRSHVRSDGVIDFTSGRRAWRNTLPNPCPSLGADRAFAYSTSLPQLCSSDIITVLQTPGIRHGPSCGLGPFQPVTLPRRTR